MKKLKTYLCYIKSHSEAPDFEQEVEATSKDEAVKMLLSTLGKYGWEYLEIAERTIEVR